MHDVCSGKTGFFEITLPMLNINKVRKEEKGKKMPEKIKIGFSREFFVGRECCLISIVKRRRRTLRHRFLVDRRARCFRAQ
jgi:hypothetical protein